MAALTFGLLAMSPRRITGDFAESIRRAASERECFAAGPCAIGVDSRIDLHLAALVMISIGRLTNAAPGRSDSAARNAAESTSPVAAGRINFCRIFCYRFTETHRIQVLVKRFQAISHCDRAAQSNEWIAF